MVARQLLGRLRESAFVPDASEVRFRTRGFGPWAPWWGRQDDRPANENVNATMAELEAVGENFLAGLRAAVRTRDDAALAAALECGVGFRFRGFSYEGAAMGVALLDALRPWGGDRMTGFLAAAGRDHIYMAHVGIGWAMARLPRALWRRIRPADPLLRWLVLDGYGFHQAYFRTERYVHQQRVDPSLPGWMGRPGDVRRCVDQGIGRALWFVTAACAHDLAGLIDGFAVHRRADLFSGAGLAATYAGGSDDRELRRLRSLAGAYGADLAQGAAFASKARERAGLVTERNETAARILCGCSLGRASAITDEALEGLVPDGEMPAYETWRARTRALLGAEQGQQPT